MPHHRSIHDTLRVTLLYSRDGGRLLRSADVAYEYADSFEADGAREL